MVLSGKGHTGLSRWSHQKSHSRYLLEKWSLVNPSVKVKLWL